jgi:uncharacterized UBP type Zn finger protein
LDGPAATGSDGAVEKLVEVGFSREDAQRALEATDGDTSRAANHLLGVSEEVVKEQVVLDHILGDAEEVVSGGQVSVGQSMASGSVQGSRGKRKLIPVNTVDTKRPAG